MNKAGVAAGVIILIIAVILFVAQYSGHVFAIYASSTTKYGYYSGVAVIGLIGIIIAAWAYMKKPAVEKPVAENPPAEKQTTTQS